MFNSANANKPSISKKCQEGWKEGVIQKWTHNFDDLKQNYVIKWISK